MLLVRPLTSHKEEFLLRAAGYEVEVLDSIVRPADDPDDVDLDKIAPGADAILQLRVRAAGLYAGLLSNDYLPRVNVDGRLQVRSSEDDLYDERLYYGIEPRPSSRVEIPPDPRHSYPTSTLSWPKWTASVPRCRPAPTRSLG